MAETEMAETEMAENWTDGQPDSQDPSHLFPRRRRREDSEMDITPMIDITFLLLIFFLVAAKMEDSTPVQLPPARHGTAVVAKLSVILTVAPGEEGGGLVYKGDGMDAQTMIQSQDLADQEEEISRYVETTMLEEGPKQFVLIKAAGGVKHREVARVAKAAGLVAEVQQLHVAVLEVQ